MKAIRSISSSFGRKPESRKMSLDASFRKYDGSELIRTIWDVFAELYPER
jgi:hypothetical protein